MAERGNNWCGAFGRVYMGMNLDSGELLAVKQVSVVVNTASKDKTQVYYVGGGGGGGTKWFPDDTWLPLSGVQVGSVLNGAGDPTTPGWPSSMEGCERLSEDEVERAGDVPSIPSLPISGADGEEILRWIGGVVAEDEWQGDEDAPVYRIGRVGSRGNHRNAWTFGAVDPNSGTAALLEVNPFHSLYFY
ncbi:putative glutamate carboxypeptidase II [Helianthus annuus]|nr:putative glutamate carboxypeptidase II [Helianthus annuus]